MNQTAPVEVLLSSIVDALTLEKSRLLAGHYTDLPKITERKLHYLKALEDHLSAPDARANITPFINDIEFVKNMARENETLLAAAKNATNAAKSRIQKLNDRAQNVGAYTVDGAKLRTHDAGVTRCKTA